MYILQRFVSLINDNKNTKKMQKPKIRFVNELNTVKGIQVLIARTTKNEIMYGGFVVCNESKIFIPCGANNSIKEVIKRALNIWDILTEKK